MLVSVDFADDRTGIDIGVTAVGARRVSGQILAGESPVAGELGLYLIGVGDLPEARTLSELSAVPGADGRFEFVGVPSGEYTLEAFSPKPIANEPRLWASLPVSVREEDVSNVEVALRVGVAVNGRVDYVGQKLRPGAPTIEKTRISLVPVDLTTAIMAAVGSTGTLGHGASLGANGGFRIDNVLPGRYLVRGGTAPPEWQSIGAVNADGLSLPDAVITVGASGLSNVLVTVVDTPLATVEGRVALRPYDLPQEFFACVFPADRALWEEPFRNPERFACQSVSAKGTYRLPAVPPGDYFVALRHMWLVDWIAPRQLEAFARTALRVSAKAGETTTAELRR
jgi:hypothetical protein